MKSILLVLSFAVALAGSLRAAQPFAVTLPEGFSGPERAARGPTQLFAFTRASAEPGLKTLFQVTVVAIPDEGKGDSLEKMLGTMLRGIERRRTGFKRSPYVQGTLGGVDSRAADWEGAGEGHALKGRMICAVADGKLYCLHIQDRASEWAKTITELETALRTFAFTK